MGSRCESASGVRLLERLVFCIADRARLAVLGIDSVEQLVGAASVAARELEVFLGVNLDDLIGSLPTASAILMERAEAYSVS